MKFNLDREYTIKQVKGRQIKIYENGKQVYYADSDGDSFTYTRDENGKPLTYENSDGYSEKYTRDENGNILTKHVNGELVIDNRPKKKELTIKQIEELLGYEIKVVK